MIDEKIIHAVGYGGIVAVLGMAEWSGPIAGIFAGLFMVSVGAYLAIRVVEWVKAEIREVADDSE